MSRADRQRIGDMQAACGAIRRYLAAGSLADGIVFDAVRMRLVEIGEAVKALDPRLLASEPGIPWSEVMRMRDRLAHRYFDTLHSVVEHTATRDLDELESAIARMTDRVT